MKRGEAITLPAPLYWSLPELCARWGCHADRPFLYMDAGLLVPSALVPKYRLPLAIQEGVAPNVVVVLDEFRGLPWGHDGGETVTLIAGEFVCLSPVAGIWQRLPLSIEEPGVLINRRELVVIDQHREAIEESFASTSPKRANEAARRTDNLLIRALATAAYPDDLGPYSIARKVRASVWLANSKISVETVAKKIRAAFNTDAQQLGSQEALGALEIQTEVSR